MAQLVESVTLLYQNYNTIQQDDVVFFHNNMDVVSQSRILGLCNGVQSNARFVNVSEYFKLPVGVPSAKHWRFPVKFSAGYRHMIRFFTIGMWNIAASEGYEYVMRLDADSYIRSPIRYNVFSLMSKRGFEYAYRLAAWEDRQGTNGDRFHSFVRRYALKQQLKPKWLLESCPVTGRSLTNFSSALCGPLYAPYNNFFVTKVSFWLSPPVQDFLVAVDASHTIYTERWGDLLWHAVALQLFMPLERVHMFHDFAYEHVSIRQFSFRGSMRRCTLYGAISLSSGSNEGAENRTAKLARIPRCPEGPNRCFLRTAAGRLEAVAGMLVNGIAFGRVSTEQAVCGLVPQPYYCGGAERYLGRTAAPLDFDSMRLDPRNENRQTVFNTATCERSRRTPTYTHTTHRIAPETSGRA
eukprot:4544356-Prymnesium_polylepis.2